MLLRAIRLVSVVATLLDAYTQKILARDPRGVTTGIRSLGRTLTPF